MRKILCACTIFIVALTHTLPILRAQTLPNIVDGEVYKTMVSDDKQSLYVVGKFKQPLFPIIPDVNYSIMAYDISNPLSPKYKWNSWIKILGFNSSDPGSIHAICQATYQGKSVIIIGGKFTNIATPTDLWDRDNIAMLDASDGTVEQGWKPEMQLPGNSAIYALTPLPTMSGKDTEVLLIGGEFKELNNTFSHSFMPLDIATMKVDNTVYGFPPSFHAILGNNVLEPGIVKSIALHNYVDRKNYEVLIGGQFYEVGMFDPINNSPVAISKNWNFAWFDINDGVWSLKESKQTSFYHQNANDIRAVVETIALWTNPKTNEAEVFVGGTFTKAHNFYTNQAHSPAMGLAKITAAGPTAWTTLVFPNNLQIYSTIYTLVIDEDMQSLYVGGDFDIIADANGNGQIRRSTAAFDLKSSFPTLTPWSVSLTGGISPINGQPYSPAYSVVLLDNDIVIGGNFKKVNALERYNLVRTTTIGVGMPFSAPRRDDELFSQAKSQNEGLTIAPNPASDKIWITLPVGTEGLVGIRILTSNGLLAQEGRVIPVLSGQGITLPLTNLIRGAYTIEISVGGKQYVSKIIIS